MKLQKYTLFGFFIVGMQILALHASQDQQNKLLNQEAPVLQVDERKQKRKFSAVRSIVNGEKRAKREYNLSKPRGPRGKYCMDNPCRSNLLFRVLHNSHQNLLNQVEDIATKIWYRNKLYHNTTSLYNPACSNLYVQQDYKKNIEMYVSALKDIIDKQENVKKEALVEKAIEEA